MGQNRKITVAKFGLQLVSCLWRTGVKLCKKVDRTSMMKSSEYDETKKSSGLLRKDRSCIYFEAASVAWHSGSNLCLGLAVSKASLKYRH